MATYARKVQSSHPVFHDRETIITGRDSETHIPIPDDVTLCDGCNQNIGEGYLIYLGKRELKANQPYGYYCEGCMKSHFGKAIIVE